MSNSYNNTAVSDSPIIPKICHMYWDGSPFSLLNAISVMSFKKYHPDWEIRMYQPISKYEHKSWNTDEQKTLYTKNDYFNVLSQFGVKFISIDFEQIGFKNNVSEVIKSDYLRYWALYTYGGVWSDCDIVYIKNITSVIDNTADTVVCSDRVTGYSPTFPVGFLMCSKGNTVFRDILSKCNTSFDPKHYQCLGTGLLCSLFKNSVDYVRKAYPQHKIFAIDKSYYLPFDWDKLHEIYDLDCDRKITGNCFGIHWFNGAHKSKVYQNNLDDFVHNRDNREGVSTAKFNTDSTIFKYIREYLYSPEIINAQRKDY